MSPTSNYSGKHSKKNDVKQLSTAFESMVMYTHDNKMPLTVKNQASTAVKQYRAKTPVDSLHATKKANHQLRTTS